MAEKKSEFLENRNENSKKNPELSEFKKELIKGLTFGERIDTRERLKTNLKRSKELLDNMYNILNTFDLDKYNGATTTTPFQNVLLDRFNVSSEMFEKILVEIKSTKVGMPENEIKTILAYEDLYYKYNNLFTDRTTKDYSNVMHTVNN